VYEILSYFCCGQINAGLVVATIEMKIRDRNLIEIPEGKRPTGRPTHRWEDIKMDFTENVGPDFTMLDCIYLA
jgi:hypothetical protein